MILTIRRATFPADAGALRDLLLGYIDALMTEMPEEAEAFRQKYDPAKIDALVELCRVQNARPAGDLLLGFTGDAPVACGMFRSFGPGVAEIQRVYVSPAARGLGAGRAMVEALMAQAKADGHRLVRLDTGRGLKAAIALYERLGFTECPPYHAETPYLDHLARYYERPI